MEFHKDPGFDGQFKRILGYTVAGGAELSECFEVISKVKSNDYNGWHDTWRALADKLFQAAEEEILHNCFVSAGEKLLRASNYYRTAYFFLEENPNDSRIVEGVEKSKKSFAMALEQLKIKHVPLTIPFGEHVLPAYLFFSDQPHAKLVMDTGGGDNLLEELYFTSALPSIKRGYHSLIFEGPGQGSVLRLQKLIFRPDWETVVKAVIDHVEKIHPEIFHYAILRGDSFGGYLAARAAAFEKRIQACIVNPGILNPVALLKKLSSNWMRHLQFFFNPSLRFKITSRYMRFGAQDFNHMLEKCKSFTLDQVADRITCPTLVIDNEEESITKGEAFKLYEKLQCPKKYYLFKKDQCTGGHCQPFAQLNTQELIFDWLETLG